MANGGNGRGTSAAIVTADQNDIGMSLGHARRHRAHARFGHQLDGNAGLRIHVLQVVDKLRQVLDGIDIVMRRRRDQSHAGDGVPHAGDDFIHLVSGKLAAFAGLRALRDFDLQIVGVHQIICGNAETGGSHLLDGAAPPVAVGIGLEALLVLAALTGVGTPADAVHGDGQGLVRFLADRAIRHGAGGESFDNLRRRLHFFSGHGRADGLEIQQAAQGVEIAALLIGECGRIPGKSRSSIASPRAEVC